MNNKRKRKKKRSGWVVGLEFQGGRGEVTHLPAAEVWM
jgi:hypothetical protein